MNQETEKKIKDIIADILNIDSDFDEIGRAHV